MAKADIPVTAVADPKAVADAVAQRLDETTPPPRPHGTGPLSETQLGALLAGLNPGRVKTRSQAGRSLSYLESWDVKATLVRVFGFGGFDAEVIDTRIVDITRTPAKDNRGQDYEKIVACAMSTVRLHIKQLDATYTETAVASQTGRDIGEVVDFSVKTAESDALKRAATYLGTQFGLSLYKDGQTADVITVVMDPVQAATIDDIIAKRTAQATRDERPGPTTDEMLTALEHATTVDDVRALWIDWNIDSAPKDVQDKFTARVEQIKTDAASTLSAATGSPE